MGTNGSLAVTGSDVLTVEEKGRYGLVSDSSGAVTTGDQTQLIARNNAQSGVIVRAGAFGSFDGDVIAEGNPSGNVVDENTRP